MSFINNALKNADQTRAKVAAPSDYRALHIVECPPTLERRSTIPLAILMVAAMALSGFMMWEWFRSGTTELKARARSDEATASAVSAAQPEKEATTVSAAPGEANSASVVEEKPAAEAPAQVAAAVAPAPITYKLQGVVFEPGRSSAVINGKTVVVGERVGDARVVSIDKDSAVIVTAAGQTNYLDLY